MPSEDLTLLMRARGSDRTARDIDQVGRRVRGLGVESVGAAKGMNVLSRATAILNTRLVMIGLLLAAISPAIALLGVGLVTALALVLPIAALGIGAVTRFTETVNQAGSAANELRDRFKSLQEVAAHSVAQGADKVLWSLARATSTIQPLVHSLQGAFTSFGGAAGHSIEGFASGLARMGPTIEKFMKASEGLFQPLSRFFLALLDAILRIGTVGVPVLAWMLNALSDMVGWLATAAENASRWVQSAEGMRTLATIWSVLKSIGGGLAAVVASLARTFYNVFMFLAPVLIPALIGLGRILSFLAPVLGPLIFAILAWAAATKVMAAAQVVLNSAMLANPLFRVIMLIVAVAAALYYAWTKSETFRKIVTGAFKAVWWVMKNSPIGWLVRGFIWLVSKIWGARREIVSALSNIWEGFRDGFVSVMNTIIRGLNRIIGLVNKANPFGDIGDIGEIGGGGKSKRPPGAARGGVVGRGGMFEVGERGREKVALPAGAMVAPYDALGDGGGDTVVNTNLVIDGAIVAQLVERHAKRKKSIR